MKFHGLKTRRRNEQRRKNCTESKRKECLVFKLTSLYLPDYLLFVLKSYFERRTFTVHLNDTMSTPKSNTPDLPQGVILPPTLFILYVPDIPRPPHTHLVLYAHDTALVSQSWWPDTISRRLSNALTTLYKYFTKWKLRLNTHKTETILFSKRRPPPPPPPPRLPIQKALHTCLTV
jgi:hypothetical protein